MMIRCPASFRAVLLASAALVPALATTAAEAQAPAAPAGQSGVADAVRVLLDQATYWQGKYQPEKADEAISRVLSLDPRNADALAMQAQMAADRGDQQAARAALAKLQAARPDDPRIAGIEQSTRLGPIDPAALADARQLAAAGKSDEAVAAYRKVFHGNVPPAGLATEFYQTLSNTEGNFEAGRDGLATLLRANPQDLPAQLAYAELLTYRDDTRDEGLARLEQLVANPPIAEQATRDLRQALIWLPVNRSSVAALEAYLARFPGDKEIQDRAELARNDVGGLRVDGYDAYQAGEVAAADAAFTQALAKAPNDPDSLIGLALVRLRQRRVADARALLRHAIEVDPEKREQYQPLIDSTDPQAIARAGRGTDGGTDYGAAAARRIRAQYAEVASLTQRGEFALAESRLRSLMGARPNAGNYLQLADIQARAGQLPQAEASYRTVLRAQPRNVAALGGLAGVLSHEGQTDEANRIYSQVGLSGGGAGIGQARAAALRQEAQQATNPAAQVQLYRSAIAADPSNPWVRLELARLLVGQNQPAEARQEMTDLTSNPRATADQLRAAIYFADGARDYALAQSLLARLPPAAARTPEMRDVATRSALALDLRSARGANGGYDARRLAALATQPDPTGNRGASFAQALVRQGDKAGARDVIRAALAPRPPQPEQRIAYAGALTGAGYPADAQRLTEGVQPAALPPSDRTRLAEVRDNAAVYVSDTLNGHGETADAYDQLAPRLAREPDNPTLNLALARLYQAKRQPREALRISEGLLQRNPGNLSVLGGTVDAAIAAGNLRQARTLADQAKTEFPSDPQAWIMSAQVARAEGENNRALSELRTARSLRRQQIDASDRQGLFNRSGPVAAAGPRYALNLPANLATDAVDLPPPAEEPVTREYAQYVPFGDAAVSDDPADTAALSVPPLTRAPLPPGPVPIQTAQGGDGVEQTYINPFRPSPAPTLDEPNSSTGVLGRRTGVDTAPTDALTQDIDRSIAQLQDTVSPRLEGSLSLRGRSGNVGEAQLFDVEAPIEASFSPDGLGRLRVQVTPVYLDAGTASAGNQAFFGTNPLLAATGTFPRARHQSAGGSALDVGYAYSYVSADVGSTPLGFQQTSIVGGIEIAPRLTNTFGLRIVADRRANTDSLLAYAGARDPASGLHFGGVTRDRGHFQVEGTVGTVNYYAGAGGGLLTGKAVKDNTEVDAGAGFSLPVWTTPTQEVRVGSDLVYFGFDRNLGNFSLGNGGYFSPQQFFAILFPASYRQQLTPDLTYTVGGSIGYQEFRAKSEAIFPNDPLRQAQLTALASTTPGVATRNAGFTGSGVAGGASGEVDYRVTNNFHVGARAGFDRSGNFTEGTGLVYGRYVFNDPI